jgi:hypothetical protein
MGLSRWQGWGCAAVEMGGYVLVRDEEEGSDQTEWEDAREEDPSRCESKGGHLAGRLEGRWAFEGKMGT